MGQSNDFIPMLKNLAEIDQKKIVKLIQYTADCGPGRNKEKWRKIEDGIFEMKSYQYRIPFFYHREVRGMIVIMFMFMKKKDRWAHCELEQARKRIKIGKNLRPHRS